MADSRTELERYAERSARPPVNGAYPTCGCRAANGVWIGAVRDWPRGVHAIYYNPDYGLNWSWWWAWPIRNDTAALYRHNDQTHAWDVDEPSNCFAVRALCEWNDELYALGEEYDTNPIDYDDYLARHDRDFRSGSLSWWHPRRDATSDDLLPPHVNTQNLTFMVREALWKRSSAGVWSKLWTAAAWRFPKSTEQHNRPEDCYPRALPWMKLVPHTSGVFFTINWWGIAGTLDASRDSKWFLYNGTQISTCGWVSDLVRDDFTGIITVVRHNSNARYGSWHPPFAMPEVWPKERPEEKWPYAQWGYSNLTAWRDKLWCVRWTPWTDGRYENPPSWMEFGYIDGGGYYTPLWRRADSVPLNHYDGVYENLLGTATFDKVIHIAGPDTYVPYLHNRMSDDTAAYDTSRDWLIGYDNRRISSRAWDFRSMILFSGHGEVWMVGLSHADDDAGWEVPVPVAKGINFWYNNGYAIGEYHKAFRWSARSCCVDLCLLWMSIDWSTGDGPVGDDGPGVEATSVNWSNGNGPCVKRLSVEWSDGNGPVGEDGPGVEEVSVRWSDGSGPTGEDGPGVEAASVNWSDGSGPPVGEDGPMIDRISVEWHRGQPIDHDAERVLYVVNNDNSRPCVALRVVSGLGPEVDVQCRLLVRADLEGVVGVDVDESYDEYALGVQNELKKPGYKIRVGVVGPNTLPLDTDFFFQFVRIGG